MIGFRMGVMRGRGGKPSTRQKKALRIIGGTYLCLSGRNVICAARRGKKSPLTFSEKLFPQKSSTAEKIVPFHRQWGEAEALGKCSPTSKGLRRRGGGREGE